MKYIPHQYQKDAMQFMTDHPCCLLALDMGLGKTSVTLTVLKHLLHEEFAVNRVLIIAPKYVAQYTWPSEVQKWDHLQDLRMAVAVGSAAERTAAVLSDADIVTINRENVIWLSDLLKQKHMRWPFDCIVIDESSSFKSYNSKRFRTLRNILKHQHVTRVVELTGTPRPRSIEDLWPQIFLLDGGQRLGQTITGFRNRFEVPGRRNGMQIYEWLPRPEAESAVYGLIDDISMSMTATDYLSLPDVSVIDHRFELTEKERRQYRTLEKEAILQAEEHVIVGASAGVLTGKLLQFANGAVYDDAGAVTEVHEHKLDILQEIMEATEDPVMVFYWYKHDLSRLQKRFAAYHPRSICGPDDITAWNAGAVRMLLAHPASMGHGLNLQSGGHIIVWFGLTWSLEMYMQANARLNRQGQKMPVQIHRIVGNDTADEDVIASLDTKAEGQDELIERIKLRISNDLKKEGVWEG